MRKLSCSTTTLICPISPASTRSVFVNDIISKPGTLQLQTCFRLSSLAPLRDYSMIRWSMHWEVSSKISVRPEKERFWGFAPIDCAARMESFIFWLFTHKWSPFTEERKKLFIHNSTRAEGCRTNRVEFLITFYLFFENAFVTADLIIFLWKRIFWILKSNRIKDFFLFPEKVIESR